MIIDTKTIYENIKTELKQKPCLKGKVALVVANNSEEIKRYINSKIKLLNEFKIDYELFNFEDASQNELNNLLDILSLNDTFFAIMLELPLKSGLDALKTLEHLSSVKDVDGITKTNTEALLNGKKGIIPCTALAVDAVLKSFKHSLNTNNITVVGRGMISGKPIADLMKSQGKNVTVCHSKIQNIKEILINSDVVVTAIGKKWYFTPDYFKKGAIIIDVGTNFENGKLYGDVNPLCEQGNIMTKTPGGVGMITPLMFIYNLYQLKNLN